MTGTGSDTSTSFRLRKWQQSVTLGHRQHLYFSQLSKYDAHSYFRFRYCYHHYSIFIVTISVWISRHVQFFIGVILRRMLQHKALVPSILKSRLSPSILIAPSLTQSNTASSTRQMSSGGLLLPDGTKCQISVLFDTSVHLKHIFGQVICRF